NLSELRQKLEEAEARTDPARPLGMVPVPCCSICGGAGCYQTPDGQEGECWGRLGKRQRWKKELMNLAELGRLQMGPRQHEDLPPFLWGSIGWSYRVVGRYIRETLEVWERVFLHERNVAQEVMVWHRLAFAFRTYHQRNGLPLRPAKEETQLVGRLV